MVIDSSPGRLSLKEALAALGVILSLLFVGLEIRQNTLAVKSSTLQTISDSHRTLILESIHDESFSALVTRALNGETTEDFTDNENTRLFGYYIVYVSQLENTYVQLNAGILDKDVFEAYGWNSPVIQTPHFLELIERALDAGASPKFAEFFRQWMAVGGRPVEP